MYNILCNYNYIISNSSYQLYHCLLRVPQNQFYSRTKKERIMHIQETMQKNTKYYVQTA